MDFGLASIKDIAETNVGTERYKAPELRTQKKYKPQTADIFGAGVVLFIIKFACPPFDFSIYEDRYYGKIMRNKIERFWEYFESKDDPISEELKDLITTLLAPNLIHRLSISEIKNHPWYMMEVPSKDEIKEEIEKKEKERQESNKTKEEETKVQKDPLDFEAKDIKRGIEEAKDSDKVIIREEREYIPEIGKMTQIFSSSDLEDLWILCAQFVRSIGAYEVIFSQEDYRIEATYLCRTFISQKINHEAESDEEKDNEKAPSEVNVRFAINILKVKDASTHCIEASLLTIGCRFEFINIFNLLKEHLGGHANVQQEISYSQEEDQESEDDEVDA